MLRYLVRYLRHLDVHWDESSLTLKKVNFLTQILPALSQLSSKIKLLHDSNVFPYNAGPLIRRIHLIQCQYFASDVSKCEDGS